LSEGLPVSIIEAMKSGLAIISSEIESGIPEIVINNKTGFRVVPGDITEYCDAIEKIYIKKDLFEILSSNAIMLSNKLFDPQIQTGIYMGLFENTNTSNKKFKQNIASKILAMLPDKYRLFFKYKL
jgi:glycosyltransferase involved in cell wall biosynthesis